ncbi:SDR family NAD(P)-dependent oxidoreductase [Microbulbifer sp. ANSA005]|uniref:SDR family NAD(P)-dependent oxidoreductase n=1 Tax=Microbulbifer sp. ANSA005 TaxID=3243362 RepID=UPI00404185BD
MDQVSYFSGKTALITGGASGIGAALACRLAALGAQAIIADIQQDLATQVVSQIQESGGRASFVHLDVRNFDQFFQVISEISPLDFLFNNAGIGVGGYFSDHNLEDWKAAIDINLFGVFHGLQCGFQVMKRQGFGHIINTASMAALVPSPAMAAYSASKSAVVAISKAIRPEAESCGVRVSILCPGAVSTPILQGGGVNGRMPTPIPPQQQAEMFEPLGPISADAFAEKALFQIAKNKEIIVVPAKLKLLWWLERLFPSLLCRLSFKQMEKILQPLGLK